MKLLTNEEIEREINVQSATTEWSDFLSSLIAQAKVANALAEELAAWQRLPDLIQTQIDKYREESGNPLWDEKRKRFLQTWANGMVEAHKMALKLMREVVPEKSGAAIEQFESQHKGAST